MFFLGCFEKDDAFLDDVESLSCSLLGIFFVEFLVEFFNMFKKLFDGGVHLFGLLFV